MNPIRFNGVHLNQLQPGTWLKDKKGALQAFSVVGVPIPIQSTHPEPLTSLIKSETKKVFGGAPVSKNSDGSYHYGLGAHQISLLSPATGYCFSKTVDKTGKAFLDVVKTTATHLLKVKNLDTQRSAFIPVTADQQGDIVDWDILANTAESEEEPSCNNEPRTPDLKITGFYPIYRETQPLALADIQPGMILQQVGTPFPIPFEVVAAPKLCQSKSKPSKTSQVIVSKTGSHKLTTIKNVTSERIYVLKAIYQSMKPTEEEAEAELRLALKDLAELGIQPSEEEKAKLKTSIYFPKTFMLTITPNQNGHIPGLEIANDDSDG